MEPKPNPCGPASQITPQQIWDLLEDLEALGAMRELDTYLVPIEVMIDGRLVRLLTRIDVSLAGSLCTCSDHRPSDPCRHVLAAIRRTRFAVVEAPHA